MSTWWVQKGIFVCYSWCNNAFIQWCIHSTIHSFNNAFIQQYIQGTFKAFKAFFCRFDIDKCLCSSLYIFSFSFADDPVSLTDMESGEGAKNMMTFIPQHEEDVCNTSKLTCSYTETSTTSIPWRHKPLLEFVGR